MEGRILVLKKQNDIFPAVMSLTNSTPVGLLKGYSEHSGFKKKNVQSFHITAYIIINYRIVISIKNLIRLSQKHTIIIADCFFYDMWICQHSSHTPWISSDFKKYMVVAEELIIWQTLNISWQLTASTFQQKIIPKLVSFQISRSELYNTKLLNRGVCGMSMLTQTTT